MPEKQKQRFLNPKGEFPGGTLKLMKDLKAHKKDSFPHRDRERRRQNKGFPDIKVTLSRLTRVCSFGRTKSFNT